MKHSFCVLKKDFTRLIWQEMCGNLFKTAWQIIQATLIYVCYRCITFSTLNLVYIFYGHKGHATKLFFQEWSLYLTWTNFSWLDPTSPGPRHSKFRLKVIGFTKKSNLYHKNCVMKYAYIGSGNPCSVHLYERIIL